VVFLINKELFKLKVMYYKLYNSPETFQRIMNSIFWKLLYEEIFENYIDDFIILSKTKKEEIPILRVVG